MAALCLILSHLIDCYQLHETAGYAAIESQSALAAQFWTLYFYVKWTVYSQAATMCRWIAGWPLWSGVEPAPDRSTYISHEDFVIIALSFARRCFELILDEYFARGSDFFFLFFFFTILIPCFLEHFSRAITFPWDTRELPLWFYRSDSSNYRARLNYVQHSDYLFVSSARIRNQSSFKTHLVTQLIPLWTGGTIALSLQFTILIIG